MPSYSLKEEILTCQNITGSVAGVAILQWFMPGFGNPLLPVGILCFS